MGLHGFAPYLEVERGNSRFWDVGRSTRGRNGRRVAAWQTAGRDGHDCLAHARHAPRACYRAAARRSAAGSVVRTRLFADVRGFSKLTTSSCRLRDPCPRPPSPRSSPYGERVQHRNTWGDALYAVLTDVVASARCALELQDAMAAIDFERLGLPGHLALRLGAHVGPVFPVQDPVLEALAFMGSHVSRTARIEPVTPPGEVSSPRCSRPRSISRRGHLACDTSGTCPSPRAMSISACNGYAGAVAGPVVGRFISYPS